MIVVERATVKHAQKDSFPVMQQFLDLGWKKFPIDARLLGWVQKAAPVALRLAADKALRAQWLRCGGTWFVGVNVLGNTPRGNIGENGVLMGQAVDFIYENLCDEQVNWDQAQVSVCYQGYPKPGVSESDTAFKYRKNRDAAHLDGLLRFGPDNARRLSQFHRFILGIPLIDAPAKAAPFVVWEGSHKIIRKALTSAFYGVSPEFWPDVDVTEIYQETRRKIFDTCRRVEVPAKLGEAYIVHRMALHGVAPWPEDLEGPDAGRVIAYFRPESGIDAKTWLTLP